MQTRTETRSPHIVKIDANVAGKDYVMGDVHGNRECLERVLQQLGEHDRLFIAGDLVDRGEDNLGVLELIMQQPTGKVCCIRGNHEDLCLTAIAQLETVFQHYAAIRTENVPELIKSIQAREKDEQLEHHPHMDKIWLHIINGGGWLLSLFKDEVEAGLISEVNGCAEYKAGSKLAVIKQFLEQLPYIIFVAEDYPAERLPFKMVHADMPLSEVDLLAKMDNMDLYLTEAEIRYATWARDGALYPEWDIKIKGEDDPCYETITYVGHTIIFDQSMAVRHSRNVVDTDVGSFKCNTVLLVNHTDRKATLVGSGSDLLMAVARVVEAHLDIQPEIELMMAISNDDFSGTALLLKMGANPFRRISLDSEGHQQADALLVAISDRKEKVAIFFWQNRPNSHEDDIEAFHCAVTNDMQELVTLMIATNPTIVNQIGPDGYNALHWAAYLSLTEMVRVLLAHPASLDVLVGPGLGKKKNKYAGMKAAGLTDDREIKTLFEEAKLKQRTGQSVSVSQSGAATFTNSTARTATPENDPVIGVDHASSGAKKIS